MTLEKPVFAGLSALRGPSAFLPHLFVTTGSGSGFPRTADRDRQGPFSQQEASAFSRRGPGWEGAGLEEPEEAPRPSRALETPGQHPVWPGALPSHTVPSSLNTGAKCIDCWDLQRTCGHTRGPQIQRLLIVRCLVTVGLPKRQSPGLAGRSPKPRGPRHFQCL